VVGELSSLAALTKWYPTATSKSTLKYVNVSDTSSGLPMIQRLPTPATPALGSRQAASSLWSFDHAKPIGELPRLSTSSSPQRLQLKLNEFRHSGQVLALLVLNHLTRQPEWNRFLQVGQRLLGSCLWASMME